MLKNVLWNPIYSLPPAFILAFTATNTGATVLVHTLGVALCNRTTYVSICLDYTEDLMPHTQLCSNRVTVLVRFHYLRALHRRSFCGLGEQQDGLSCLFQAVCQSASRAGREPTSPRHSNHCPECCSHERARAIHSVQHWSSNCPECVLTPISLSP